MWRRRASESHSASLRALGARCHMNAPVWTFFGNSSGASGTAISSGFGPCAFAHGRSFSSSKPYRRAAFSPRIARVSASGLSWKRVADRLARVRERALVVGIVAAPEDALDADLVAAGQLARRRRARAVVAVARGVEARRLGRHRAFGELELADRAGAHALPDPVEVREHRRHPRAARLGGDVAELRKALEHTRHEQVRDAARGVEARLDQPDRQRDLPLPVVGRAGAAVLVQHDAEVLTRRVEAVHFGRVERRDVRAVGRHVRQEHAAAQPVLGDPLDVRDRLVDVVQVDEPDPGAALGRLGAEVDQPAVVRADPLEPERKVLDGGVAADQHAAAEERRHGVREDDLARDALRLHVPHPLGVVPVLVLLAADVLALRVAVAAAPLVEELLVLLVEVVAVGLDARAGV